MQTHGRIITVRPVPALARVDVAVEDVEATSGLALATVRLSSWPSAYADDAERQADEIGEKLGFPVMVVA